MSRNSLWESILETIYPSFCQACKRKNAFSDLHLCLQCYMQLVLTDHMQNAENRFMLRMEGRIPVANAAAMFLYSNSPVCKSILKAIKYRNRPKIAYHIGVLLGEKMIKSPFFNVDIIIPVPLHYKKLKSRTYNQSQYFGMGLSHSLKIPCEQSAIKRIKHTASMTTLDREDRFENIIHAFKVREKEKIQGKRVLLVDDVVTTGATLEACGKCIVDSNVRSLSLACIAFGKH